MKMEEPIKFLIAFALWMFFMVVYTFIIALAYFSYQELNKTFIDLIFIIIYTLFIMFTSYLTMEYIFRKRKVKY